MCQVDFLASLAALAGQKLAPEDALDSFNILSAFLGDTKTGRDQRVEQAGVVSLRQGSDKLIEPGQGLAIQKNTHTETGLAPEWQLYNLKEDPGEQHNRAKEQPERAREMERSLMQTREKGRTR